MCWRRQLPKRPRPSHLSRAGGMQLKVSKTTLAWHSRNIHWSCFNFEHRCLAWQPSNQPNLGGGSSGWNYDTTWRVHVFPVYFCALLIFILFYSAWIRIMEDELKAACDTVASGSNGQEIQVECLDNIAQINIQLAMSLANDGVTYCWLHIHFFFFLFCIVINLVL